MFYRLPYEALCGLIFNLQKSQADSSLSPRKRSEFQWQLLEARHVLKDRIQRYPFDVTKTDELLFVGLPVVNNKTGTHWIVEEADFSRIKSPLLICRWGDNSFADEKNKEDFAHLTARDVFIDYARVPKLHF